MYKQTNIESKLFIFFTRNVVKQLSKSMSIAQSPNGKRLITMSIYILHKAIVLLIGKLLFKIGFKVEQI